MSEQCPWYGAILPEAENKSASGRRTWKFQRDADAPSLPKVAWSVTITDVYQ